MTAAVSRVVGTPVETVIMQEVGVTNLRVVHVPVALTAVIAVDYLVILVTLPTKVTAAHVVDASPVVHDVLTLALAHAHVLHVVIQMMRGVTTKLINPLSPQVSPSRDAA